MKNRQIEEMGKLGLTHLQTASQVALGNRATMLCKSPQNTILVNSWQGSFPPVLKELAFRMSSTPHYGPVLRLAGAGSQRTLHMNFVVVIRREAKAYVENRLSTFANILYVYRRYLRLSLLGLDMKVNCFIDRCIDRSGK